MTADVKREAWEASYARRENFLFHPGDEVIRFVAKHLRKRVGLDEFVDVVPNAKGMRVLDVGCGIGRNLVFANEMGFDAFGVDLSEEAVVQARAWWTQLGLEGAERRIVSSDVRRLPWSDGFFDHALCDSVLDSMPFEVARAGVAEVARVVKRGGLFYCSLISGDETGRAPDFSGEVEVGGAHERGTIQSYFDAKKIDVLLGDSFEIVSRVLVRRENDGVRRGRWHVASKRK